MSKTGRDSKAMDRVTVGLVGAFPPPVHGAAAVNLCVRDQLASCGAGVEVFDLAASGLSRAWKSRIERLPRLALQWMRFLRFVMGGNAEVGYFGLSGGAGLIFEILFVLVARAAGTQIFLHHHSFAYLDKPNVLMRVLVRLAGRSACHIVLCENMRKQLLKHYIQVRRTAVLSNAFCVDRTDKERQGKGALARVGFLSNISFEKGIEDFLETAEYCGTHLPTLEFVVAGPFQDSKVESYFHGRAGTLHNVTYVGPVYGANKEEFLTRVDVLIFPSHYRHEAEPLTVLESLSRAIPVISTDRGCLSGSRSETGGGLRVWTGDGFAAFASRLLTAWHSDSKAFDQEREYASKLMQSFEHSSVQSLGALFAQMGLGDRREK